MPLGASREIVTTAFVCPMAASSSSSATPRRTQRTKDKGFIAWVGTYDDIKECKPGRYRVSLLKTFKDGFYPGLHLLPDGIIVATTYANYRKEDVGCSIVSVRFTMSEVDEMAKALK